MLITADLLKCGGSRAITIWFISRIMCNFWFFVCLLSGCLFIFDTRFFRGMSPLLKFNANSGFDWLFFLLMSLMLLLWRFCLVGSGLASLYAIPAGGMHGQSILFSSLGIRMTQFAELFVRVRVVCLFLLCEGKVAWQMVAILCYSYLWEWSRWFYFRSCACCCCYLGVPT